MNTLKKQTLESIYDLIDLQNNIQVGGKHSQRDFDRRVTAIAGQTIGYMSSMAGQYATQNKYLKQENEEISAKLNSVSQENKKKDDKIKDLQDQLDAMSGSGATVGVDKDEIKKITTELDNITNQLKYKGIPRGAYTQYDVAPLIRELEPKLSVWGKGITRNPTTDVWNILYGMAEDSLTPMTDYEDAVTDTNAINGRVIPAYPNIFYKLKENINKLEKEVNTVNDKLKKLV